ncbi:hypothetical protein CHS0354_033610, partial [Potamilus streckersoni]
TGLVHKFQSYVYELEHILGMELEAKLYSCGGTGRVAVWLRKEVAHPKVSSFSGMDVA